ncbi:MAG: B12-binding domain-containing radical SAM protein [Deltaproteobacteria bacterium]|nr:MAG: B12-binding domain-containing radical SAM protein [Deltaproteobacteria bacterium]
MKIMLVNPPANHSITIPGSTQILFEQHYFAPPLGIMYIKSYLQSVMDAEVKIFNFQVPNGPSIFDLEKTLIEFKPEVVGITVMTVFWYDACQIAKKVKEILPNTIVVCGGSHTWLYPAESLSHRDFDVVVQGEGEITFTQLIERLESGQDLEGLPGIWYRSDDQVIKNHPRPVEPEPDLFPFPDRSDFDIKQHRFPLDRYSPAAVVITSRGCPYHCTFCQNNDHHYRRRLAERVVDEILECKGMGYNSVDFYDDNFNQSRRHVESLCHEMIKHRVNMPWICRARVDRIDRDLIKLMAETGCKRIHFGVESATQRILDEINKGINIEQAREAFALAKEAGISTVAYFIIGFPGETLEEANNTIALAFELDPDYPQCLALMPVPSTPIYEKALKDLNFGGDYIRKYVMNPYPDLCVKIWPTAMTEKEILTILRRFYLRFYFRPRQISRYISRLTSPEDLFTKVRMALKLIKLTMPR